MSASSSESDDGFVYESDDEYGTASPMAVPTADYEAEIVTTADVQTQFDEQVRSVSSTLAVTPAVAMLLLRCNGWSSETTINNVIEDRDRWFRTAGIPVEERRAPTEGTVDCPVCWTPSPAAACFALGCGHAADRDCWRSHVSAAVRKGADALSLSCVMMDCKTKVDGDVVRDFATDAEYARYQKFELKQFVEAHKNMKWCINPKGCDLLAVYNGFAEQPVVNCRCGFQWCFRCHNELHKPCPCPMVEEWMKKNQDSSEDIKWIMAHTKTCPKCKSPIEKNQGCMHMTCRREAGGCGHEFCWLCLGPWADHGTQTGGFYQCNIYAANKEKYEDRNKEMMKQSHDRYMRYYQRYHEHGRSKDFAERLLEQARSNMSEFERREGWDGDFYVEAAALVITCRHTLKWTYVYGYYIDPSAGASELLFETQLAQLESHTETLTDLIERPIEKLKPEHIKNYTRVTQQMLRNLVSHWERTVTDEE